ncbi:MAG: hypothetical protein FWC73_07145 [Defluviitaleaceae bacterium]|nr:hypothetical protein [Defluviitaleaceae bacterium]
MSLPELLSPYRVITIIGMAKNSGKTTTLNHLIKAFRQVSLTSIGRDGESVDVVTGTDKSRIFVYKNTVIATAEKLLPLCDISKEILDVTGISTPLGRVVIVRALSDGFVQLGGPSIAAQIADLLPHLPGDKILIDGAVSRKTQANIGDAVVLCTGASFSPSMVETIRETRHIVEIFNLHKFEGKNYIYIPGAVMDSVLHGIKEGETIVAEDPGKILISSTTYDRLRAKKVTLAVRTPLRLAALTINPTSPYNTGYSPNDFLEKMQEAVTIPVYNLHQ